jgi:hypothetical protein
MSSSARRSSKSMALCSICLAVTASSGGRGKWDKLVLVQGSWLDGGGFGVLHQQRRLDTSDLDLIRHAEHPRSTSDIVKCMFCRPGLRLTTPSRLWRWHGFRFAGVPLLPPVCTPAALADEVGFKCGCLQDPEGVTSNFLLFEVLFA